MPTIRAVAHRRFPSVEASVCRTVIFTALALIFRNILAEVQVFCHPSCDIGTTKPRTLSSNGRELIVSAIAFIAEFLTDIVPMPCKVAPVSTRTSLLAASPGCINLIVNAHLGRKIIRNTTAKRLDTFGRIAVLEFRIIRIRTFAELVERIVSSTEVGGHIISAIFFKSRSLHSIVST